MPSPTEAPSSGTHRGAPFPWFTSFLAVACVALTCLVLILSQRVARLRAELDDAMLKAQRAAARDGQQTMLGLKLASISAVDASGARSQPRLDAPGRRLVLVGSAQCHVCEAARPFWAEIAHRAADAKLDTVCLLTDNRPNPHDAAELGAPVFLIERFESTPLGALPTVPAVLLLRDGVVERVWLGSLEAAEQDQVRAALTDAR